MNGCEAGHMFALKSTMKQRPYAFLFYTLVLTIVLFGYQLKVFEGPLSDVSNQNFNKLQNAMWMVIITLTTTGFGDLYPKSTFGRLIGLIICFWGTFMVSFFVVTVNNMLTFTPSEEKSFNLLQRLHFKEELKEYAVNVLSSSFRHRNLRLRYEDENQSMVIKALRRFRGKLLSFRQAVLRVRMFYEGESEMDILQRQIDDLHDNVKDMSAEQSDIKLGLSSAIAMIEAINSKINDESIRSSHITSALTDEIGGSSRLEQDKSSHKKEEVKQRSGQ
ncbi:hypothetical protein FGO68_gene10361 [Halteria grandinella]|uniref:Potassium channel domain-containing protein n=1 Tax=Halteria grandinella TaxID=5974 RepID=A0A8J8STX7_HALGN|nr:hypothetical protein FGO68_gene10361 [Halteria grandinella]